MGYFWRSIIFVAFSSYEKRHIEHIGFEYHSPYEEEYESYTAASKITVVCCHLSFQLIFLGMAPLLTRGKSYQVTLSTVFINPRLTYCMSVAVFKVGSDEHIKTIRFLRRHKKGDQVNYTAKTQLSPSVNSYLLHVFRA